MEATHSMGRVESEDAQDMEMVIDAEITPIRIGKRDSASAVVHPKYGKHTLVLLSPKKENSGWRTKTELVLLITLHPEINRASSHSPWLTNPCTATMHAHKQHKIPPNPHQADSRGGGGGITPRHNVSRARLAFLDHGAYRSANRRPWRRILGPRACTRTRPLMAPGRRWIARGRGEAGGSRRGPYVPRGRADPVRRRRGSLPPPPVETDSRAGAEEGRGPPGSFAGAECRRGGGALRGLRRLCKQSRERNLAVCVCEREREEND
jgi:hypothetical protein